MEAKRRRPEEIGPIDCPCGGLARVTGEVFASSPPLYGVRCSRCQRQGRVVSAPPHTVQWQPEFASPD